MINSGYRKAEQQSDQVQHDLQVGRERAEADARAYALADTQGGATGAHEADPTAFGTEPTTQTYGR